VPAALLPAHRWATTSKWSCSGSYKWRATAVSEVFRRDFNGLRKTADSPSGPLMLQCTNFESLMPVFDAVGGAHKD
jgi:hypothetical protein